MASDLRHADFKSMHEPFASRLEVGNPRETLAWLTNILNSQSPALRASNATLVAYTGCPDAISWLETAVGSPVTANWGIAAALLGTSWLRISDWIKAGGSIRLMGLDALVAYRAPAANMSPLHQIVAPVLPDAPTHAQLDSILLEIAAAAPTPRIEQAIGTIRRHAREILAARTRNVATADLPQLFLQPEKFPGADSILAKHETVSAGIRQSIEALVKEHVPKTKH